MPKTIAKSSSAAKSSNKKMGETGKSGMPRKNEERKGVAYKRTPEETVHPMNAPSTP